MEEEDERVEELSSIAAIFPELTVDPTNHFSATLDVPVAPERPLKIFFQAATEHAATGLPTPPISTDKSSDSRLAEQVPAALTNALKVETHELSYLPALTIKITLPPGYPHEKPPQIALDVKPRWLPQTTLDGIRDHCSVLWEEYGREQVVYTFIDYVKEAADKAFGLADGDQKIFQLADSLKLVLLDYDMKCKKERFENETFDCGVCLEPKKGRVCHKLLLCGHVFCVECLQDFYNNCITEGDVDNVKCLAPDCAKDATVEIAPGRTRKIDKTLNPSELLQIPIDQEQVQRYVRLKRKKILEADKTTVYCPRQWCQGAAKSKKLPKSDDPLAFTYEAEEQETAPQPNKKKKKKESGDPPMSERLCICEDCEYAFCSVCKKGWHGEGGICRSRPQAELNAEEKASLEYMQRFSTPCPTCNAPSQKTHGCNHMICFKCKTHFCYLCSAYLMPQNPYAHFNDLKSTCYMRLWELEGGDGADAGLGFAGGAGNAEMWEPDLADFQSDAEDSDEEEDDLDEENMNDFRGDGLVAWQENGEDESSSDDEPAPDQRRPNRNQIEIVNFRGNGAVARIDVPGRPVAVVAPPAAPEAPRRRRRRRGQGNRHAAPQPVAPLPIRQAAPARVPQIAPAMLPDEANDFVIELAAPGQGNNINAGLQRFLQLAIEDREDEWDSDEENEPVREAPIRQNRQRRR